jgi:hypothetical protein
MGNKRRAWLLMTWTWLDLKTTIQWWCDSIHDFSFCNLDSVTGSTGSCFLKTPQASESCNYFFWGVNAVDFKRNSSIIYTSQLVNICNNKSLVSLQVIIDASVSITVLWFTSRSLLLLLCCKKIWPHFNHAWYATWWQMLTGGLQCDLSVKSVKSASTDL